MDSHGMNRNVSWGDSLEYTYYIQQELANENNNNINGGEYPPYDIDESSDGEDDDDQEYDSVSSRSTITTPLLSSSFAKLIGIDNEVLESQPLNGEEDDGRKERSRSSSIVIKKEKSFKEFMTRDIMKLYIMTIFYVVYILLYGLLVPQLFINYVFSKYPDRSDKDNNAEATRLKSIGDALPYLIFFFVGPLLGVFCDKFGRKKTFFIATICYGIDSLGFLMTLKTQNLIYYYVGHSIGGISQIYQSASLSYLADITDPEDRTRAYGLSGACAGIGILLGPAASILLSSLSNLYYTMYGVLSVLGICLIFNFIIPETLDRAPITAPKVKRTLNPFKACWRLFSNSRYLCFVSLLYASYLFVAQDTITTSYMYARIRYHWNSQSFSIYMVFLGIAFVFWNAIVIPFATKRFSERKIISFTFCYAAIFHVFYGLAYTTWMYYIASLLGSFSAVLIFTLPSLLSKGSPPEIQGSILSSSGSLSSLSSFLGTLASQNLMAYFTSSSAPIYIPGAQFFVNSIVLAISCIGSILVFKYCKSPSKGLIKKAVSSDDLMKSALSKNNIGINDSTP